MKKITSLLLITGIILTISCKKAADRKNTQNKNEYLIQSVLWYQHSGEMKALCYQAYNTARLMLDEYLEDSKSKNKKAVIVDIDETVINNIVYEAEMILTDSTNTKSFWKRWVDSAVADTLPGALEFLKYARSKGVEVFYISNRATADVASSLRNLQKFNFPDADENHMIFKTDKSKSKEQRRKLVAKDYDIVLLCGDNLGDFSSAFDDRTDKTINDSIQAYKSLFGKKFIMLPNPMYGYWEKQIYGDGDFTDRQRDSIRKEKLKGY
jgi:5'-nucleotidase (lipoprotein e(P4) family)